MEKYVDVEALNLRSEPVVSPTNRIGILHIGQKVQVLAPADDSGWINISADIDGEAKTGFVKAVVESQPVTDLTAHTSLRDPVSPDREVLVAEAIKQWLRFERGQGKENVDPYYRYVGEMWKAIGLKLDGRDRDIPWSAAAISFIVRNSGATADRFKGFKFAPSHSQYMHDSIARRKKNDTSAPFWGYRLHERQPQIGDIVGGWRDTPSDYDDAESGKSFKSHSDIVISVRANFVLAIGGNISQSVSISQYPKTPSGFMSDKPPMFILMAYTG